MATIRSVPLHISGKDYELRFEQPDVIAIEEELKIGYIFLFTVENKVPTFLSLKMVRSFIHHGLRTRTPKGDFEYTFTQGPGGATEAGNLIENYIHDGGRLIELWEKAAEAFSDWFGKSGDVPKDKQPDGDEKNSP